MLNPSLLKQVEQETDHPVMTGYVMTPLLEIRRGVDSYMIKNKKYKK